MTEIELDNINKIYFVGIGGIAMSAVAGIAREKNFEVEGSDGKEVYSPAKDVLDRLKIPYHVGYAAEHVDAANADLYILSAGEDMSNPEVARIVEKGMPRASFAELLYHLYKDDLRVVVAGTHGKSTTAGLMGHLFKSLDDSSFMVGAVLQNYESNFHNGDGHYAIFEGDEYKSEFDDPTPKFQYYKPDILVLTNLEFDHPDLFPNMEALEEEFRLLISNVPEDGLIVYNADDHSLAKLVHESNVTSVGFGFDDAADMKIESVKFEPEFTTFNVLYKHSKNVATHLLGQTEQYKIQLPGKINIYNATACIAALRALGFGQEQILLDLLSFKGVKRRFELVGRKKGIALIDDYAHHPTAVKETLDAARLRYPESKIWAVFEPHTFSRTKATLPELTGAFRSADEVLISDIYPAREKAADATITSEEVVEAIKQASQSNSQTADQPVSQSVNQHIRLVRSKDEAKNILKSEASEGDVIIVMAVGSFNRLAYELKESL